MTNRIVLTSLIACMGVSASTFGQDSASASIGKTLAALLDERKLESVAARVPGEQERFVAALYFSNGQLYVVSARYSAPSLLDEQISNHNYRDVYVTLSSAGTREGKLFIEDLGAVGLQPTRVADGPFDSVQVDTSKPIALDGDWTRQGLSEADYKERFKALDERYAKILTVLVTALKGTSE